jgi:hypothetical protein
VNQAPSCSLTSPTTGTIHPYGTIIRLAASAADRDGAISKVEFHDGDLHMGEDTTPPYTLDLSNMSAGSHTLTVRAYDNHGSVAVSKAVSIIVRKASSLH